MTKLTILDVARRIPPDLAQLAVAQAFAVIGSSNDVDDQNRFADSKAIDCLSIVLPHIGVKRDDLSGDGDIPSPYSSEESAQRFWAELIGR